MKKKLAVFAVIAMIVGLGGIAYAYFTATGSGDGTASVGSSTPIELTGTITGTLYPAGAPAGVSVLVRNNGSGSQHVGNVHLQSITADGAHSACDVSVGASPNAFTMADIPLNTVLAASNAGTTDETTVTGSLQMNDTNVSQDSCQGATLTLHFTSAA